ncbi:MAG: hypothetical protein JWO36_7524 [Myxococcales bacterium]|nr:hypothetical protein [Myxococcales bacterium]
MNRFAIAGVLVVSAAHASPSYVAAGATAGDSFGQTLGGFYAGSVEGGHRLGHVLWLHAMVAEGGMVAIDGGGSTMSSNYLTVRIGSEARWCVLDGALCALGGADVGYRHERLAAQYDHYTDDRPIGVLRAGLDAGSSHVRFRPGLELSFGADGAGTIGGRTGIDGIAAAASVAYQW